MGEGVTGYLRKYWVFGDSITSIFFFLYSKWIPKFSAAVKKTNFNFLRAKWGTPKKGKKQIFENVINFFISNLYKEKLQFTSSLEAKEEKNFFNSFYLKTSH